MITEQPGDPPVQAAPALSACPICGQLACTRRHPEVSAWSDGWSAIETVCDRLCARQSATGAAKDAAG